MRSTVLKSYLPPAALLGLFFLGWELGVAVLGVPAYLLPPPSRIFQTFLESKALLVMHAWVTAQEIVVGFALAFVVGMGFAFLIVHSPLVEKALYPLIIASQTIPVFAIAPLLIVWFGYGIMPKVVMTALITFFPMVVNGVDGLRAADPDFLNLLRTLKATRWQLFWKVRLPAALPFFFSGIKIGVAVSVIGAVIGEWVGSDAGLGYLMLRANAQLQTDLVFAVIALLSLLGVGLFVFVVLIERIAIPWQHLNH
ncbi:MAG: ABC transporter permease [Nitrospinota bacterium]|nr:MAG: ABC transporter permease [Nitrospinota bacterium]